MFKLEILEITQNGHSIFDWQCPLCLVTPGLPRNLEQNYIEEQARGHLWVEHKTLVDEVVIKKPVDYDALIEDLTKEANEKLQQHWVARGNTRPLAETALEESVLDAGLAYGVLVTMRYFNPEMRLRNCPHGFSYLNGKAEDACILIDGTNHPCNGCAPSCGNCL